MRMYSRARVETPDGREVRLTRHTVRGKDAGTLQVAMWDLERGDWQVQELSPEEVRHLRDFMNNWLGEDN